MIHLATPWMLLLLIPAGLLAYQYILLRKGRDASMIYSAKNLLEGLPVGWRVRLRHLLWGRSRAEMIEGVPPEHTRRSNVDREAGHRLLRQEGSRGKWQFDRCDCFGQ